MDLAVQHVDRVKPVVLLCGVCLDKVGILTRDLVLRNNDKVLDVWIQACGENLVANLISVGTFASNAPAACVGGKAGMSVQRAARSMRNGVF